MFSNLKSNEAKDTVATNAGKAFFQAKLAINQPGDQYEQEADAVADKIMQPEGAKSSFFFNPPPLQRKCAHCEEEEKAQRKEKGNTTVSPALEENYIQNLSGGEPLQANEKAFFESRIGADFSSVRIHDNSRANESVKNINARAYTHDNHIIFGSGEYQPGTDNGKKLMAHELTHVVQQTGMVQRKCGAADLGSPAQACTPSTAGVVGWQFLFKTGCDELLPGEEANLSKIKTGYNLKIHGYSSKEGSDQFAKDLSCHRANRIADLLRLHRADCPIEGIFSHGESPVTDPKMPKDINPPQFWQSVNVEQTKPAFQSGEQWLDPTSIITTGWALHRKAQIDPIKSNLDEVAALRPQLKTWLEAISKSLAPAGMQLTQTNITDYKRFYAMAEGLWASIDITLSIHKHADAAKDTYVGWVSGTGKDQGDRLHAKNVPSGAKYHIDIFGEGYFKDAINIGMAERTSTTGVNNTRVPNLIYRRFSGSDAAKNKIPIADHIADLVTSENGPIGFPGLADEIARIIAPGGTIVLYNPESEEQSHDNVAKACGGTIKKTKDDGKLESVITVPGP